jgi:hypothetical protein
VLAFGQEEFEPRLRVGNRIRPRYPDGVEAVLARGFRERCFQRRRIGQKSRSA